GCIVDFDQQMSEQFRVVQLTPPGSGCSIVIGTGVVDTPPGSVQGLQLVVSDIDAARAQLLEHGVDVSTVKHFEAGVLAEGPGDRWNSFIFFKDPDGNGWTVQESPGNE